jgi:flagellar motor switch protein FliN/FliY
MSATFSERDLASDLTQELAAALEAVAGASVTMAAAPGGATGAGWLTIISFSGVRQGSFAFWVDKAGAGAIGRLILGSDEAPDDPAVSGALREMWAQAASSLTQRPRFAGLKASVTEPGPANAPGGRANDFVLSLASLGSAQISVTGTLNVEATAADDRSNLDLVLDIELPLTVRFGRAIMSLQSLAELGPGSVVDMGRSPDDAVELLVSDRVFARGEVVVVGGNYGVRVTDLVGTIAKPRSAEI